MGKQKNGDKDFFSELRDNILNVDPVRFCEQYLTLDGSPFRLTGNGYKPFADIYRYIALRAVARDARPCVLVKGRQVGATTMAAALECYFAACGLYGINGRPPMRIMHLFPTLSLCAAYSKDKLGNMITNAKLAPGTSKSNGLPKSYIEAKMDMSSPANNNQHFKKFLGGNQIWIESPGADGDRIRGLTVDLLAYDEVQDIPQIAIGASSKIATKARWGATGDGIQLYFGTPKQSGTSYYNMWKMSTQQYYHLGCESCGKYFPLYRPDVNWEEIWLYGFIVKCTECGHEQNKVEAGERGKWIPFVGEEEEPKCKYVGYHINQLYIPEFSKEKIVAAKPENNPQNTERIYQNEVLGEFYNGEGATLTPDEIQEKCGEIDRPMVKMLDAGEKRRVYAGFDFGQKGNLDQLSGKQRGQSYSCGVILTVEGPKLFSIQFATRFKSNEPEAKEQTIEEMYRRYSIHLAVGDIGDAWDLTHKLQRKYNERFLASRAAPKVTGHIKFNRDIFPKEIVFERDYYYSELIGLIKEGCIKFPYGSYEAIYWLVQHCCSMEIKVTRDRSHDPKRHYVKGNAPNDGFAALLNAYLAYKFDITQGFTIKQPQFMKYDIPMKKRQIPAVLGYVPRSRF